MALTINEIEAMSDYFKEPGVFDQYFKGNALMYRLLRKGKKYDGGKKIKVRLGYGQPHGGSFNDQDTFDTNKYEEHTAAFFRPGWYYEPITYDLTDESENTGAAQEVDLIQEKLSSAQKKIRQNMANDIYASTSYGTSGRSILGLKAMISTATTSYGEISSSDLTEWTAGAVTSTAAALTLNVIRTLATSCVVGDDPTDEPTMALTTRTLMDVVKSQLTPQLKLENAELADFGFKNVVFEGKPIVADYLCPSGYLFMLNENYMDFKSHRDFFFQREPWMRPPNARKFTTQIIWIGQLVCKRRNAHGMQYNLS